MLEDASSHLETRLYPVLDLVGRRTTPAASLRPAGSESADYDALIDAIATTIDPDSWDDVGGPGSIAEFDNAGVLIISQTQDVHAKIEPVLAALRKAKGLQGIPSLAAPAKASSLASPKLNAAESSAFPPASQRRRSASRPSSWQVPQVHAEK